MTSDLIAQLEASNELERTIAHLSPDEKNAARRAARERMTQGTASGEADALDFDAHAAGVEAQPGRDELCGDVGEPVTRGDGDELRKAAERRVKAHDAYLAAKAEWKGRGDEYEFYLWSEGDGASLHAECQAAEKGLRDALAVLPPSPPAGVRQPATPEEAAAVIHAEFPAIRFFLSESVHLTRTSMGHDGCERWCRAVVYKRAESLRFDADNWADVVSQIRTAERSE